MLATENENEQDDEDEKDYLCSEPEPAGRIGCLVSEVGCWMFFLLPESRYEGTGFHRVKRNFP